MQERMIFAGFGGQGLLTAGKLLAACAMAEGRHVTYYPTYGSEVRGGTAHCHVVIDDEPVASPLVEEATALLIMNQASLERFLPVLARHGLMVLNTSMAETPAKADEFELLGIPASEMANELGSVRVANMIMLSALNAARNLVKPRQLHDTLVGSLGGRREEFIPVNEKALEAGRKFALARLKKG